MTFAEETELRATHAWGPHPFGGVHWAKCRRCGLGCGRHPGGDGWGIGNWKYYDEAGNYAPLTACPKRGRRSSEATTQATKKGTT